MGFLACVSRKECASTLKSQEENLYDKAFVEKWTHGFAEYAKYCEAFTPEKTEEITGVPAEKIVEAARLWTKGPGVYISTPQSLSHN